MELDVSLIDVGDRLREDPGEDFNELVESIRRLGQIQPIVVASTGDGGTYRLVAGERRLRAIILINGRGEEIPGLSPGKVKAEFAGELSPELALTLEFEENVRRKDFSFQEKAKYVKKFHSMFMERSEGQWTAEMTAIALKLSPASVSYYLELDKMIDKHPEVAKAKTMRGAIKRVKTIKEHEHRMLEVARESSEGVTRANTALTKGDGVQWLKDIPSDSIDLVNLDPPWGENSSYKTWQAWETFDDTTEYATEIIPLLLKETLRVLKPNRFCIYWYRTWAYKEMTDLAREIGFSLKHSQTPCIWFKPDKITDKMAYPEKQLITSYETFLLLRKGDPIFYEKEVQNVFVEPRVPVSNLIHPTEKPVALMDRLIRLLTVPGEVVIDPTCGSGSTLEAAFRAFRKTMGCELDSDFYQRCYLRLVEVMK